MTTAPGSSRLILDLVEATGRTADGATVTMPFTSPAEIDAAAAWCRRTGNTLVAVSDASLEVRRGRLADPLAALPAKQRPGYRLWIYTNFDCNLACDYCCVASSPRTSRRALGFDSVRRIVDEAIAAGVRELYVTGGEPFLAPDIGEILACCASSAPTTVLTNAMLFRGARLAILDALPRSNLILQVSLDSATSELHDRHRGAGSFVRARSGIDIALELGFRVRVAATFGPDDIGEELGLDTLLDTLGIPDEDRVIRRIAHQGVATSGLEVSRASIVPEVCVTADGVCWHPVAAADPTMYVTDSIFPIADAIAAVRVEFVAHRRRGDVLATSFPCA